MKTIETYQYQCEICGNIYDAKEDAEKCEAGHARIKEIVKAEGWPDIGGKRAGFPLYIHVNDEKGDEAIYIFQQVTKSGDGQ